MCGSAQAMTEVKVSRRAVFLDRDGVINPYVYNSEFGTVDSPANPEEFTLVPGVGEAITQFNHLGLLVIVVSNQPGIAKGRFSKALLDAMTRKNGKTWCGRVVAGSTESIIVYTILSLLVEYRMTCDCRKPAPGMLLRAAAEWNVDLKKSYMVGDGIVDILAGQAAGTFTMFISPRKSYVCDELSRQGANQIIGRVDCLKRLKTHPRPRRRTANRILDRRNGWNWRDTMTYSAQYIGEAIASFNGWMSPVLNAPWSCWPVCASAKAVCSSWVWGVALAMLLTQSAISARFATSKRMPLATMSQTLPPGSNDDGWGNRLCQLAPR